MVAMSRTDAWLSAPIVRGARASFAFLTRVPVGGFPYEAEDFRWASAWFPLVGMVLGCVSGAAFCLLLPAGPWPAAAVSLFVVLMLTGAFHEDGLADTADALGGSYERARLFDILKDSRVGTFGAAALFLSLLCRAACLTELYADALLVHVIAQGWSRVTPTWLMGALPYVTSDARSRSRRVARAGWRQVAWATGLGCALLGGAWLSSAWLSSAWLGGSWLSSAWLGRGLSGVEVLGIVAATAAVTAIAGYRFVRRAGGITGDFLGATQQLSECTVLLVLASFRADAGAGG